MFSFLKRSRKPSPAGRKSNSFRPACEALEDRLVMSTLPVSNPGDTVFGGTLRWAVNQANADSARGIADTIVFANSLRGDTIKLNSPLVLTPGTKGVTINATNDNLTISGTSDAFVVDYRAQLVLQGVSLDYCSGSSGGAINNDGTLSLTGCHFGYNHANYGGAIYNANILTMSSCGFTGNSAQTWGGAVYTKNVTNAYGCSYVDNTAGWGGAIYNDGGSLYVLSTGNQFSGNAATRGAGGAIYNAGYATVNGATFAFNTTVASGGAIANFNNGSLYVGSSAFNYNSAHDYGGGLYDGQGYMSYSMTWLGNHAGVKGPDFYFAATGKAG